LGKLVKNGGEPLATDILSLDFLLENGSRITIQKGTAKMLRAREDLLRVEKEDSIPTTSKSGWLNEPGLECLTLQGTHGNISITRDFSIEMLDVAADLSDVAKSLSELIDLVGPYLEVESLSADQAASASD